MHVGAIAVVLHPERDSRAMLECITGWARRHGAAVRGLEEERDLLHPAIEVVPPHELVRDAAFVIGLGGDGTILRALRLANPAGVPVLGVNLGRLAFLAEVDLDELPDALDAIERGAYRIEAHSTVQVTAPERAIEGLPRIGFNDAALTRVPGNGPAALAVQVEDEVFGRYTADALVIATPTGSTAYSFAAGGPIVSPRHQGLLVTPVAPHAAFDRAVFLHPEEPLRVHVLDRSAPVLVEVDGRRAAELRNGDVVELCVSDRPATVLRLGGSSFYERARRKLQLVDSSELVALGESERA